MIKANKTNLIQIILLDREEIKQMKIQDLFKLHTILVLIEKHFHYHYSKIKVIKEMINLIKINNNLQEKI